jgi:S-DNA-T family DNA segregation ATPase FtsK/SpoIIIE
MARKASTDSSHHGFNDTIGVALLAAALLLLVAQVSFDRYDLAMNANPPNRPAHNWIGPLGAQIAHISFLLFGFSAYMLPLLLVAFGLAYWLEALSYLRRRWLWAAVLLVSCMGWLHLMDLPHLRDSSSFVSRARTAISAPSIGGFVGMTLHDYFFWMLGSVGAGIAYGALDLISLLFLTNFQLGQWVRGVWGGKGLPADGATKEEQALEKRARDLQKQASKLEEEVERSGLGADMQPVPEPMVRDLSVSQSKPGRARKPSEPVKEPEPADEVEIIPAHEVAAATTGDILGKKSDNTGKQGDGKSAEDKIGTPADDEKSGEAKTEINISGIASPRPKKKPKPLTVASTPMIGNYQLPPMDFLQHPDINLKPTESREELLANARLMQQTLAQFEIPVELGDITKGPTITRYELHPAPGVKLEKITALNNNIAAALKAERIHILAPVPG